MHPDHLHLLLHPHLLEPDLPQPQPVHSPPARKQHWSPTKRNLSPGFSNHENAGITATGEQTAWMKPRGKFPYFFSSSQTWGTRNTGQIKLLSSENVRINRKSLVVSGNTSQARRWAWTKSNCYCQRRQHNNRNGEETSLSLTLFVPNFWKVKSAINKPIMGKWAEKDSLQLYNFLYMFSFVQSRRYYGEYGSYCASPPFM